MAKKGKDYVAVRLRRQLALAVEAGMDVAIKIGVHCWSEMRMRMAREIETESRVEYLRAGAFGKWKGHWLFLSEQDGDPKPYPKGNTKIEEIEKRRMGRW